MGFLRPLAAFLIAGIPIVILFPLLPWAGRIAAFERTTPFLWLSLVIPLHLTVASAVLPAEPLVPRRRIRWHPVALTVGAILLLEPLLQLTVLGTYVIYPDRSIMDLILPPPPGPGPGVFRLIHGIVTIVLIPAIAEEWFFRGRLLPWLSKRLGTVSAISLSTLFFATAHGSFSNVQYAIPLGLVLALVYVQSGNLYACIAGHAVHNMLMLLEGSAIITAPIVSLILAVGGIWLIAFAASHAADRSQRHWRYIATVIGSVCAFLLIQPVHRWLHDRAWVRAVGHLIHADPQSVSTSLLAERFWYLRDTDILNPERHRLLVETIDRRWEMPEDRRACLQAVLAMDRFLDMGQHCVDLRMAIDPLVINTPPNEQPLPPYVQALAQLARLRPLDFMNLVSEYDDTGATNAVLLEWLEPTTYRDVHLAIFNHLTAPKRWIYAGLLRQTFDEDTMLDIYLRMASQRITPKDRYYVRRRDGYPAALRRLQAMDPVQAERWVGDGETD